MARAFIPVALTANDLIEGDVVWWTGSDWSRAIADSRIFHDETETATAEALLATPAHAARVVGIYRVEVRTDAPAPVPLVRREEIRAEGGPTFPYLPKPAVSAAA